MMGVTQAHSGQRRPPALAPGLTLGLASPCPLLRPGTTRLEPWGLPNRKVDSGWLPLCSLLASLSLFPWTLRLVLDMLGSSVGVDRGVRLHLGATVCLSGTELL